MGNSGLPPDGSTYLEGGKEGLRQAARVLETAAESMENGNWPPLINAKTVRDMASSIRALAERGQVFGRGQ